jgi:L-alanine-DL-glutamate epimerase-like enolase superfamily enzyme
VQGVDQDEAMRIAGITVRKIRFERAYFHWCDDLPVPPTTLTSPFLRIQTDEGLEGHCFNAIDVVDAGIDSVATLLVGQDPFNRERIWHRFWKAARWRGYQGRLGTVDVALWDLVGKAVSQPVYRLLGGYRDEMPAYASTLTLDSVQEYEDLAVRCVEKGYQAINLHVWGKPEKDLHACRAVRTVVGDDIVLMLDSSSMYTLEEATWMGRALEEMKPLRASILESPIKILWERRATPRVRTEPGPTRSSTPGRAETATIEPGRVRLEGVMNCRGVTVPCGYGNNTQTLPE